MNKKYTEEDVFVIAKKLWNDIFNNETLTYNSFEEYFNNKIKHEKSLSLFFHLYRDMLYNDKVFITIIASLNTCFSSLNFRLAFRQKTVNVLKTSKLIIFYFTWMD